MLVTLGRTARGPPEVDRSPRREKTLPADVDSETLKARWDVAEDETERAASSLASSSQSRRMRFISIRRCSWRLMSSAVTGAPGVWLRGLFMFRWRVDVQRFDGVRSWC